MTKTQSKMLETIREYTKDGYTVSVFGLGDRDYRAVLWLEANGYIKHAYFVESWTGSKNGYISL
jgi:hypothetical protein